MINTLKMKQKRVAVAVTIVWRSFIRRIVDASVRERFMLVYVLNCLHISHHWRIHVSGTKFIFYTFTCTNTRTSWDVGYAHAISAASISPFPYLYSHRREQWLQRRRVAAAPTPAVTSTEQQMKHTTESNR